MWSIFDGYYYSKVQVDMARIDDVIERELLWVGSCVVYHDSRYSLGAFYGFVPPLCVLGYSSPREDGVVRASDHIA